MKYPEARRDNSIVDDYHGNKIADPYQWLEDPDSEETAKFVDEQNEISSELIDQCPIREKLEERITEIWDYPKYSCPYKRGNHYYYYYNEGLQNQNVLYVQDTLDKKEKERVFLDPNLLSEDGTISLRNTAFSDDGQYFAYCLSERGSDWVTIRFKKAPSGEDLPDVLENVKFTSLAWTQDNKGLFYNQYPEPDGSCDGTDTTSNLNQTLYYHRLGEDQSKDVLVAEFPDNPTWMIGAEISDCGQYLILTTHQGRDPTNRLYYTDLTSLPDGINGILPYVEVVDNFDAEYEYVTNEGTVFTFKTNLRSPRYKLINIDFANYHMDKWKTLVPQDEIQVLEWAACVNNNKLVLCYMEDVKNVLYIHDLETGKEEAKLPLDVGTVSGYSGKKRQKEIFYQFVSFLTPGVIYHCNIADEEYKPQIFREIKIKNFDLSQFETIQVFYTCYGTKIPMFIVQKKGVKLDGNNPVLLYGYGGFSISICPSFSPTRLVFLQHLGGVYALANIRGGGEYGENWHRGGMLDRKQNVFDDFQAAAEYLIQEKYTCPKKLIINGASHGGLLVAACANQRPDLFGCAISQAGLMDMLRFHKFTIGHSWVPDYGCSDHPEQFDYLIRYSPLHNIRIPEGKVQYPAMLLLTGDHDDRVVPLHSLKYIAQLQYLMKDCAKQTNPLLLRVDTKTGHGIGKPTEKQIEELTDIYCFIYQHVGLEWTDLPPDYYENLAVLSEEIPRPKYPEARRDESIVEDYHGFKIADPYQWLEDPDSEETAKFVDEQNEISSELIDQCPIREKLEERITDMWDYPKYSCPYKRGDHYYYYYNEGLQNQSVMYVQDTLSKKEKERVFLDPNLLSEDGTISLRNTAFSDDGQFFAYCLSEKGSDWVTIRFKKAPSGEDLPDVLENVKFTSLAWTQDNKGLFYNQYPEPDGSCDGTDTTSNLNQTLYYHRLGEDQSKDVLVAEFPDNPTWMIGAEISDCGQYLILTTHQGRDPTNKLYYTDLTSLPDGINGILPYVEVVDNFDAEYEYVTNEGTVFTFKTNLRSPRYKLINIDFANFHMDKWKTLVAEDEFQVLEWAACVNDNKLVLCYMDDVKNQLYIHDYETGKEEAKLPLDVGTVSGYSGKKKQKEIFYQFVSFLTPGVIYHCNLSSEVYKPKIFRQIKIKNFDLSQFETIQVFYTCYGTKIPMFIVKKKGLKLDGNNPVLLYGYGGFSISICPSFSPTRLVFLQHLGGVYALANIRGGGEYGENWHRGGMLDRKQNVFDDFQAAAEYLIQEKYTCPKKLIINGASHGGLLVAACANQRPDLFGCAIAQAGLMDMLRFHKFTIGHTWIPDYGCSDHPEQFDYLIRYSPLHNIRIPEGKVQYPAMLLLTGDHDDRVVPLHSLKYIAQLQFVMKNCDKQTNPLLLRVDTKTGHGIGKPTDKQIEELTDILCFIYQHVKLEWTELPEDFCDISEDSDEEIIEIPPPKYPEARRDESIVDDYHGFKIADPYQWLEDPDSEETAKFVDEQNEISSELIDQCPMREKLEEKITEMWDYPKYSCPYQRGDHYYYYHNEGLQNQSVMYVQDTLSKKEKERVFLDPNLLSEDGTISLRNTAFSDDGQYFAYCLSERGSDWVTIRFKKAPSGEDLPDVLENVKFTSLAWTQDNKGLFYNQYPEPDVSCDGTDTTSNLNQTLYYHRLGEDQSIDVLVAEFPENPTWMIGAEISDCGQYLILTTHQGRDPTNRLYYTDLTSLPDGINGILPYVEVVDNFDAEYEYVTNEGTVFTFKTNLRSPRYKLINIDFANYHMDKWKTLVPEDEFQVLEWAACVNNKLVLCYLEDVKNLLYIHDLETGKEEAKLPLDVGTVSGYSGKKKQKEIFYQFVSFLTPGVIYHCDLSREVYKPKIFRQIKIKNFDLSQFETIQVFYTCYGTKIPMFIVQRKGLKLDGNNPVLLYGYGGFSISICPSFSPTRLVFLQHLGGVYALANIRGGGEYGENWHRGGMLDRKQNVFDDFQAAAEYLIQEKYTCPKKLIINGASHGGLLVAACANQRPDLFGCAIAQAGLMDMLRFHKFTIGHTWVPDYGCSDHPEQFDYLIRYSPLHNIRIPEGAVQYPAMLLLTGDHDDRVVPLHSLKYIAQLQYVMKDCEKQTNPLLLRVDTKTGHGIGKPTDKQIEELTDILCFIYQHVKLEWTELPEDYCDISEDSDEEIIDIPPPKYPEARRDESIVDDYHGFQIPDPYQWLEDPDSEETAKFVDEQNVLSSELIDQCPIREKLEEKITEMWDYPKYSCPYQRGDHYYYYHNEGLQNQSVMYVQDTLSKKEKERVFLDPNLLSEDGTISLRNTAFSDDGQYFAYCLSERGSDWVTIRFKKAPSGEDLPDVLENVKFTSLAWTQDNEGLFYNQYPEPDVSCDGTDTTSNLNQTLYYHRLGEDQSKDVLVAEFPDNPTWMIGAEISDCGQYLILTTHQGRDPTNRLYYTDLTSLPDGINGILPYVEVVDNFDAEYEYVTNEGTVFTFKTNLRSPRYKLINIDFANYHMDKWKTLVPEDEFQVLEWAACVNNKLVLCYLEDVKNLLYIHDYDTGKEEAKLPLDVGTVSGYSGKKKQKEIFYQFVSFLTPGVIYHCDLSREVYKPKIFRQIKIKNFDLSQFETIQVFYTCYGTKIPMFIVKKKGLKLDGNNPVLLYGYGGFSISICPSFSPTRLVFLQHLGGVYALANIRGGGEYGENWHRGGMLDRKQNVFDDFQAAAEYLIQEKYTCPKKLIINGASHGGLLVAACANQRPDLFGCAIAQAGLMDMLRFHKFTIGHTWVPDYGCSDHPEQFDYLIRYSPLHNIRIPEGDVQYPAMLLLTGDHDDRVVPLHSLKYIAQLQYVMKDCEKQTNPLLLRVDTKTGHGIGKPTDKQIEELTDILCFIYQHVKLEWTELPEDYCDISEDSDEEIIEIPPPKYPEARRDESIVDDYHGFQIADPYQWLEDPDSEETAKFVDEQNKISSELIDQCPIREKLEERITEMWDYPKYSCPYKRGNNYYYYYNEGLQNQSVLYVQDTLSKLEKERVFLDPNLLSEDGTISLRNTAFSDDGQYFAYCLSERGSDWVTIKFKKAPSGEDLPDVLENVKFTSLAWTQDNKGLFYNQYPEPDVSCDGTDTTSNLNQTLYYHRLGEDQSKDVLVAEFPENPTWMIGAEISDCGQYLILTTHQGRDPTNRLYYTDLTSLPDGINGILPYVEVVDNFDAEYEYVTNEGTVFTFKTNLRSPRYKLINIDFANYHMDKWKTLVPQDEFQVLEWAACVNNNKLVLCYMEDVKNVLYIHDLETGKEEAKLPLDVGTVSGYSGKKKQKEIFYLFVSFLTPGVIYHCDISGDTYNPQIFREIKIKNFDLSQFETIQVFYTCYGTKIPMFIVKKKGVELDGNNPVLLYGYGGFSISICPSFSQTRLVFLQHLGGVYALANIRGGGEYGENWHRGGMLDRKQNVFDDFQAAAEYLIQEKYTCPEKLVIYGSSHGGLLVAACANQRPELFGCAISQAGLMDMLRFHKFTIGHTWVPDYGCSDHPEQFDYLIRYSPLHNIRIPEGDTQYPAMLLLTGDHDDRVVPLHSLKYIAQLQYVMKDCEKQTNPLLLRVDTKTGHGLGKPTNKQIEELTDIYCFIYQHLKLEWTDLPPDYCDTLAAISVEKPRPKYPEARRDETIVEDYHGYQIPDPYQWLEDPDSEETAKFVDEQNEISSELIDQCPIREKLEERITEMWDYPKYSCPYKRGDHYYFYCNEGLQNQSVLYVQDTVDKKEKERVFLDPNLLSEDGTISLRNTAFSDDGKYFAYCLSERGSDWVTIKFKKAPSGEDLPDVLENVKFTSLAWTQDNKGLFYNQYPEPDGSCDGTDTTSNLNQTLYYHRLGEDQSKDVLVAEFPENPTWMIGAEISDCGKYLILTTHQGRDPTNRLYYTDLTSLPDGINGILPYVEVVDNFDAEYEYVTNEGTIFTFKTNLRSPRYKLINIDFANYQMDKWKTLVPEDEIQVLEWAACVNNNKLVLCFMEDVKNVLYIHDYETGKEEAKLPLDVGTVSGYSGKKKQKEIFYQFVSFLTPGVIYHCDFADEEYKPEIFREIKIKNFDLSQFETIQVFYTCYGTKIPMFIVQKKGVELDGNNPVLLYGYGGFSISICPSFSPTRLVFLQQLGGIYALANIRGGGEYGENWHRGGMLDRKQNVFDDFQAAAEYLIQEKYTCPKKLIINGASHGGLLVAACANQRPDLFGCAISQAGLMDMLRFHKFTIGHTWVPDYGCSDHPEQFDYLIRYSPLHNIRIPEGKTQYPAMLLLTGDHDDRVVPLHSLKYIAQLQYIMKDCEKQTNPLLLRVDTKTGHGIGKPTDKQIEELTDIYCFIYQHVKLTWTDLPLDFQELCEKIKMKYPEARRDDTVVEDYHGTQVPDPYRWLEDPDAEETAKFVDDQNVISSSLLEKCPIREKLNKRITEMWDYPKYSCPYKRGDHYYYYYNTGLQNQSVLYVQDTLDSEARVFLDPNSLSEDGTVSLRNSAFSDDGKFWAYGLSKSGSDWVTIKFKKAPSGEDLPDVLENVKFTSLAWTHDNAGLFYNRYPKTEEKSDGTETASNLNQKLYYHRLGEDQSKDILVAEFPDEPKWMIGAEVSDCGQYLIITISQGCEPTNRLYYTDLKSLPDGINGKLSYVKVVDNFDAEYEYITNEGTVFTFKTNLQASRYKLINIDFTKFQMENWTTLIPEDEFKVLEWVACVNNNKLVLCYLEDVKNQLYIYSLETGKEEAKLPLDVGTVSGYSGKKKQKEIFYQFVSFLTPGVIYHCDISGDEYQPKIFRQTKIKNFDLSQFETVQVFYSSNGTKIPMFIVQRKGTKRDSNNPVMLYGYGGFNISITPSFSVSRLVFLQHLGGVYAVANIRGGGEYGEDWHKAGIYGNKQNVFDDFQAAAEYLVKEKYTCPERITINGGSNGGLLVAACANQRPDLFGCVINQVGVMDMLRFHKFTIGHAWTTDFGCADKPEQFEYLIKYSPLHNIRVPEGKVQYPAMLLLTGDHDDRVVPLHSLKYIAQLQYVMKDCDKQTNPLVIRVDTKSGHGAGKPTKKIIEELTDVYSFIYLNIGLQWTD